MRYEKEHIDYVLTLYKQGLNWHQINHLFNQKFNADCQGDSLRKALAKRQNAAKEMKTFDQTRSGIGDIIKDRNIKSERIFVTAAMPIYDPTGQEIITHQGFMKSIDTFLDKNKGSKLYVLPMRGHSRPLQEQPNIYDKVILRYRSRFITEMDINNKLKIFDAQLNPQQINPLTGLHHITDGKPGFLFRGEDRSGMLGHYVKNRKPSLIIAHPKQLMETQPTGKTTVPRMIHGTGSCDIPNYLNERIGKISHSLHTLGGLIIDIVGDYYFIRQVQADLETGEFVDLGFRYHPNGRVTEERALIMKPGDRHVGETCPMALKATYEQAQYLQPLEVMWEDYFTGGSVNHHLKRKLATLAMQPDCFKSLQAERELAQQELQRDLDNFPSDTKHLVNDCNHHRFLEDWLEEVRFKNEPHNFKLGHELQCAYLRGLNPVQVLIDSDKQDILDATVNGFDSKMEWLSGESSYMVEGVENGEHGHNGIKGSRGSKRQHYLAYTKANVGHFHSPFIFNGVYSSGMLAEYKQSYNKKQPISGLHTNIVQYSGGHRQLLTEIGGVWAKGV